MLNMLFLQNTLKEIRNKFFLIVLQLRGRASVVDEITIGDNHHYVEIQIWKFWSYDGTSAEHIPYIKKTFGGVPKGLNFKDANQIPIQTQIKILQDYVDICSYTEKLNTGEVDIGYYHVRKEQEALEISGDMV